MEHIAGSVIVPIYNAEPYLDQALESVAGQTYKNLEIICLNDGSTDNSLAIMRAHAARDERIVVIDKHNQGYGATCNRGLDESHGEWISILEPDDWIESGMYSDLLALARMYPEPIDIVKSGYWRIWLPDTPKQRKMNCSYHGRINPPVQPFAIKDAAHLLCHHPSIWSAIYRKQYLLDKGRPTASSIPIRSTTAIARRRRKSPRRSRSAARFYRSSAGTT